MAEIITGKHIVFGVPPSDAHQAIDTGGLPYDLLLGSKTYGRVRVHHRDGRRKVHAIEVDSAGHWILGPTLEEYDQDRLAYIVEILDRLVERGNVVSLVTGKASGLSPIGLDQDQDPDRIVWAVEIVGPNLKTASLPIEANNLKEAAEAAERLADEIANQIVGPGTFDLTARQQAELDKINQEKGKE